MESDWLEPETWRGVAAEGWGVADERSGRLVRLLEYLNQQERPVPVSELAELAGREFGVSEVTLRSDLAALCGWAGIRKLARGTYEAARDGASSALLGGSLFGTRLRRGAEPKIAIAAAVARLLAEQDDLRVLLLDAGTTPYYVADCLSERAGLDLIVWTPNVAAATRLAGSRGVSVRLLAGEYQPDYAAVSGDETVRALLALGGLEAGLAGAGETRMEVADASPDAFPGTHCVLAVNYVSAEGGLFTDESRERPQKRLMARLATDLTIVADHSKLFGRRLGFQAHAVDELPQLGRKRSVRLVTDAGADLPLREQARRMLAAAFPAYRVEVREEAGAVLFEARAGEVGPGEV